MKKAVRFLATGLASIFSLGLLAACGGDGDDNKSKAVFDNENDPLVFSTLALDKVFNPFFSTSATDGNVVGMTQIGMLANDEMGNPVWGDDEAVVAKDVEINTTYQDPVNKTDPIQTEYKFVLKNNIRFSNGSYLSMKDVLFNLYVYLDPAYTGSSTIYSTEILGLQDYRTQSHIESEQDSFRAQYEAAAQKRIDALLSAFDEINEDSNQDLNDEGFRAELEKLQDSTTYPYIVSDYDKVIEFFKKELESDWTTSTGTYQDTVFTNGKGEVKRGLLGSDAEQFLYNEGLLTWSKNANGGEGELSGGSSKPEDFREYSKEQAIDYVYETNIPDKLNEVVQYWKTAEEFRTFLVGDAMEKDNTEGALEIPNITGIKFANKDGKVTVNGQDYDVPQYEDDAHTHVKDGYNEVLSITIKEIDPKAIWNFAFSIAPMYYYSDPSIYEGFDYETNFGVEYRSQSFMNNVVNSTDKVGVPVGAGPYAASKSTGGIDNITAGDFYNLGGVYFERNPYYNPDGNGPAKIKKVRYSVVAENQMVDSLYTGAIDFVEPNAKPGTINELNQKRDQGIGNKNVQTAGYGYIGVNAGKVPNIYVRRAIMYCINTQETVDYYGTTAKPIYRSMSLSSWVSEKALKESTSYYPYINGPVPANLNVVDPDYKDYVTQLGKKAGDTLTAEEQENFIRWLVGTKGGYTLNSDNVYVKNSDTCKYTFTVVGDETDHPAFQALWHAQEYLNKWGFDIEVKTDTYGLQKLSTGDLTVWAAAWGSTIDPDMYQVYHKDSTATSVKNWGYPQILRDENKYPLENQILKGTGPYANGNGLSDLIESARKIDDSTEEGKFARAQIYKQALDLVMVLAIELPTYQRDDLFAYNTNKIDVSTFTPESELSAFKGLTSDIHLVSLNVAK